MKLRIASRVRAHSPVAERAAREAGANLVAVCRQVSNVNGRRIKFDHAVLAYLTLSQNCPETPCGDRPIQGDSKTTGLSGIPESDASLDMNLQVYKQATTSQTRSGCRRGLQVASVDS